MSNSTEVKTVPGNGLPQLFSVLEGQAGDRGVHELFEGVRAILAARLEERAAFREQQAKLQAELDEVKRAAAEQQTLLERVCQKNTRLTADPLANGEEIAELRGRVDQLEKEPAQLTSERDAYLRAIHGLLPPPESSFTEEELSTLIHSGLSLEDTLQEIEAMKDSSVDSRHNSSIPLQSLAESV